jgi:hypothetical protein
MRWTVLVELAVPPDAAPLDLGEIDLLIQRATRDGLRVAYEPDRHALEFVIDAETHADALHAVFRWWRGAAQSTRAQPLITRAEINRESDPEDGPE